MTQFQSNQELVEDLVAKSIQVATLGNSVLQPQFFNKFVQEATRQRTILNEARRMVMNSHVVNIDRIGFSGRIMEEAVEDVAAQGSDPVTHQEKLVAKEYIASVGINDRSLRRNIEREGFTNTLIGMSTAQFGVDWETLAVFGDTTKFGMASGAPDPLLRSGDGWMKKGMNKLYGKGNGRDYNPAEESITEIMTKMIKKYPQEYLNRGSLRFYLNSNRFDEYVEEKGLRPTAVGDTSINEFIAVNYKGIPVVEAPVLNDTVATNPANWGACSILADPNNLVYGIFEEITVEADRQPKLRKTDYIFTTEVDQSFENPNLFVAALDEKQK